MQHLSLFLTVSFLSALHAGSVAAPGAIPPTKNDAVTVENNEGGDDPLLTAITFPNLTSVKGFAYTYQRKDTRNALIEALTSAAKTIDIAAHIIDEPEIIKALQSAKNRGVEIRLFIQKSGALQGKHSAINNFNIQDIAYQTTKITTYFMPDLGDQNFKYSVQKMAFAIVDQKLVSLLTHLPCNANQQYFTQGLFFNNPELAKSLKIVFDYNASGRGEKPAALKDYNHLYNKSQLIIFGGEKGREKLKEWCRFATQTLTVQTQKLDDINFVDFLLQMRKMGRNIKIITSEISSDHTLENLCIEKGIEIKVMNNISGTIILLDHETALSHMFIGPLALTAHDFKYANSLGWAHKQQEVVKNTYSIFDTLWKQAKVPDFVNPS